MHIRLPAALLALLGVLVLPACGSSLDEQRLRGANGALTRRVTIGENTTNIGLGSQAKPIAGSAGAGTGGAPAESVPGALTTGGGSATGGGAIGAGSAGTGAAATSDPGHDILLGSFGTGSGPIGAQLATIPIAVRAWMADVNARGGLSGHRVKVIFGDDGGDPGKALAIVKRMVEQDKVLAFIGTYGATTIQAVTSYLEQRQIPVIGSEGGNPIEDVSPMVFDPQLSADAGPGSAIVTTLVNQSPARKLALMYCREAATCTNGGSRVKQYAAKYGVNIVFETQVSLAQPDFTAEMITARNRGADAVAIYIDVNSFVRAEQAAHRQGYRPQFVGGVAINEEAFKVGGKDVEGTISSAATVPYATSSKLADYRSAVARYVPGGAPGGTGASAWVAGKLLERVARGLPASPTTADILRGLYALHGDDLGGLVPPLTFPKGAHGKVNLCSVPVKFQNGGWTAPKGDSFLCAPPL